MAAVAVAAVALTSCVGLGAENQGRTTAAAQRRGGGVTSALVDDAIEAVADETGADPLQVHSITARLAEVVVVVPAADGGREEWRYGTSGLYGGRGLGGPEPSTTPVEGTFAVAPGDVDVDAAVDTARPQGDPGAWVDHLVVARPSEGAEPVVTVEVTAGSLPTTVVVGVDGAALPEGAR